MARRPQQLPGEQGSRKPAPSALRGPAARFRFQERRCESSAWNCPLNDVCCGPGCAREESLSDMCAQRFYPQPAAKLGPLPLFLDLFIPKDFECNEFGSVHSERLTRRF